MTLNVPYVNLSGEAHALKNEMLAAFEKVLLGGDYILGPELKLFEAEFASYCQAKRSIGLSDGTHALIVILRALGMQGGDEVITAPNSFIASTSSIALVGAKPVFADIRSDGNIDPERMESAITSRTKALMPVHLTGRPARMTEITEIAKKHHLFVIEDACQAVGAELDGKRVGSWGDAAAFSLHPLKNLRAIGDGGMVTTNNPELAEKIACERNHGLINRETCERWSFNCRLDELQAALVRIQLKYLDTWTEQRRKLAFRYNDLLRPFVEVPDEGVGEKSVYQTYVIKAERRDALLAHLRENGVVALIHYATPIHLQPAARSLGYSAGDFPNTMKHVGKIISLPLFPSMTHEQQDRVIELIANFYKK